MDALRAVLVAAFAAAAIPSTLAIPTVAHSTAGGDKFSITQVRNNNFQRQDGLQTMLRVYAKYNASLSPQLQTAVKMNAAHRNVKRAGGDMAGSVSASPPRDYDYEFATPIDIGTPPQTLNVVIDTGSADFWVLSTDTPPAGLAGQPLYNPANSETSELQQGSTWSITYGDGSGASGITYSDVVSLGSEVHATNQTIQSPRKVSSGLASDSAVSGLLGLGMSIGNTVRPTRSHTLMDTLRSSLKRPLFTVDLQSGAEGRFDFGYIDEAAYTGRMQWVPVNQTSVYWRFMPSGYSIGSGPGAKWVAKPWAVIADTGTSLLLLPDEMVKAYYASVKGAVFDQGKGGMVLPCDADAPDFVFGIGYYRGVVPGRYMNYNEVNETHCFGGIQSSEGIGFSIFGDVLLKAQFVVFDLGGMRLGFANKRLTS